MYPSLNLCGGDSSKSRSTWPAGSRRKEPALLETMLGGAPLANQREQGLLSLQKYY